MPELVRLTSVIASLLILWLISAGLMIHGMAWGLHGLELAWRWFQPDLVRGLSDLGINSDWLPGVQWGPAPSFHITARWTVYVAGVLSALPVLTYCVLPVRRQIKAVLGYRGWAMTRRVSGNEILGEFFADVKRHVGVRKPVSLYLVATDSPLAFAMGAPFRGSVVLSQGLVNRLAPDELQWVIAHELAHIRYRDMLLGALWISSIQGLQIFERLKVAVINLVIRVLVLLRTPVFLVRLLVSMIQGLISIIRLGRWVAIKCFLLVDRWVSRRTEFRADHFAAQALGGGPGARALSRLGGDAEPLFNGLFATHPKISVRIQRLLNS